MTIEEAFDIALKFLRSGRGAEAEGIYRQILAQTPDNVDALHLIGIAAFQAGKLNEAEQFIRRAIELNPRVANIHNHLGNVLQGGKRFKEAVECYRRAIQLEPNYAQAYSNLANSLTEIGQPLEAITACRQAIQLQPNLAEAHLNLGPALRKAGRAQDAIAAAREAIRLSPGNAKAYGNLGSALIDIRQDEDAEIALREAIRLDPKSDGARWNLMVALFDRRKFSEGWEALDRVNDLRRKRVFPMPKWNGQDAAGKTILIHTEGGFGDSIQFVRLIPMLKIPGARIILECEPALAKLFQSLPGIERIVPRGETSTECDFHLPLMSLPRFIGVPLDNIPGSVPYLRAPSERIIEWKHRLEQYNQRKIGLVWAGSTLEMSLRSRTLEVFRGLGGVPGLHLFSLQKDPTNERQLMDEMKMIDFTAELHDFSETAALIENLDLVISVDTAVAHLAGALGKPVWTLIPSPGFFIWMQDRTDSPWYPTMRLFRQKVPGDWREVSESVAKSLGQNIA